MMSLPDFLCQIIGTNLTSIPIFILHYSQMENIAPPYHFYTIQIGKYPCTISLTIIRKIKLFKYILLESSKRLNAIKFLVKIIMFKKISINASASSYDETGDPVNNEQVWL